MKKAPVSTKTQGASGKHESRVNSIKHNGFTGTTNPRHLRALQALLVSPQPREAIDSRSGCPNGPDLVAELRRRGMDLPCQKTACIDRDGFEVKRGIYYPSDRDRVRALAWLRKRGRKHHV